MMRAAWLACSGVAIHRLVLYRAILNAPALSFLVSGCHTCNGNDDRTFPVLAFRSLTSLAGRYDNGLPFSEGHGFESACTSESGTSSLWRTIPLRTGSGAVSCVQLSEGVSLVVDPFRRKYRLGGSCLGPYGFGT